MKRTLVIGSTCLDVTLAVPVYPFVGGDVNIKRTSRSLGGCAHNVSDILRKFSIPFTLCSPVGTGFYSSIVEQKLKECGIKPFARIKDEDNGVCYCIVDEHGRQTFMAKHGSEYRFNAEWFSSVDWNDIDSIYCCGLEMEDVDGDALVSFIEKVRHTFDKDNKSLTIYFAPGARIMHIPLHLMERTLALRPIVHLNENESLLYTRTVSCEDAAHAIHNITHNSVIITLAERGAFCFDHKTSSTFLEGGHKVNAIDSTGAGDAHFGAVIASTKQGCNLKESVKRANILASKMVTVHGSCMTDNMFKSLF